jgi:hypothetical protein
MYLVSSGSRKDSIRQAGKFQLFVLYQPGSTNADKKLRTKKFHFFVLNFLSALRKASPPRPWAGYAIFAKVNGEKMCHFFSIHFCKNRGKIMRV